MRWRRGRDASTTIIALSRIDCAKHADPRV
jgi:hypothetical protein